MGVFEKASISWAYLRTTAGATAATILISQFLKFPLDKVWKIPTRLLVYAIALTISLVAGGFADGFNVERVCLDIFNSFVIAAGAYGGYELTFAKEDNCKTKE